MSTKQIIKNPLKGLTDSEFFAIRDIVIKSQKRMKDRTKIEQTSEAWLKIEKAWYNARYPMDDQK